MSTGQVTLRWKLTVQRTTIDRTCLDEDCNCSLHRQTQTWTFYPDSAIIRDTGHQYEIHGADLLTVPLKPDKQ